MTILIEPVYSPDEEFFPEELSEQRLAELNQVIRGVLLSATHVFRVGQACKWSHGYGEQVGLYVTPLSTGKERYLDDLKSVHYEHSQFPLEVFRKALRQVLGLWYQEGILWVDDEA